MTVASRLVAYAASGPEVGLGHVVRSAALCRAWIDDHGPATLVADHAGPFIESIQGRRSRLEVVGTDAWSTIGPPGWVTVDGYGLDDRFADRHPTAIVGSIDDFDLSQRRRVDLVIDQNLDASPVPVPGAVQLLGPSFALLRPEFRDPPTPATDPRLVGVGIGGSTVAIEACALEGLAELIPEVRLKVLGTVPDALVTSRGIGISVDPIDAWAAAALVVSAAGTSIWELCRLARPMVLTPIADNQRPMARRLAELGAAVDLGPLDELDAARLREAVEGILADPERRQAMGSAAAALVDGQGARRSAAHLRALGLVLRPAALGDAELLHRWRNDPEVRRRSFDSAPVPLDGHRSWLGRRIDSPDSLVLIGSASDEGEPFGVVRFERIAGDRWEIGVSLAAEARGTGLATPLLLAGLRRLAVERRGATVLARIKPDNAASIRAFTAAGFSAVQLQESALAGRPDSTLELEIDVRPLFAGSASAAVDS